MNTLVLFYSYKGHTKLEAEKIAKENNYEIIEIIEAKKRGIINAFFNGCPAALKQKASKITTPAIDMTAFNSFIVCAPIWAGFPAPAFNSMLELLPKGSNIEIVLCSGGGESPKGVLGAKAKAEALGMNVISIKEIKTQ